MTSFSFPSDERLIPRFSEIRSGPQQRIYERPLWDLIPLPLFEEEPGGGLWNDGGVLALFPGSGYPTSSIGLAAGAVWNDGLTVAIVPGITPDPRAPPAYFYAITASILLALGGGDLPLIPGPVGSEQIWNNGGLACIS